LSYHLLLNGSPFKAHYGSEPNLGGMIQWEGHGTDSRAEFDWQDHTAALQDQLGRA
jgi:hypothetical protein